MFLFSGRAAVRITRQSVNFGWMRRIVQVGLSPALIIALDNVLLISINVMLRKYGGADSDMLIACAAIMQSFMLVITMPLGGITAGTQSILGYNYGACDEKRVMKAFRCIVLLCLVFCGIMFLLAQTVSGAFVKIFTKDPAYIDMAAYMIRTYSLGVLGLTIQYPFVDGMTGMGLVKWGLTFSMIRKGIFLVSVFVLPPIFGATAVMFSEPLSDVVSVPCARGALQSLFYRSWSENSAASRVKSVCCLNHLHVHSPSSIFHARLLSALCTNYPFTNAFLLCIIR